MKLGKEVGLDHSHIVLKGLGLPRGRGYRAPSKIGMFIVHKLLYRS